MKNKKIISFLLILLMTLGIFEPVMANVSTNLNNSIIAEEDLSKTQEIAEKEEISSTDDIKNLEKDFPLIADYLKSQEIKTSNNEILTMVVEFNDGQKEQGLRELRKIPGLKVKYEYDLILYGAAIEIPIKEAKKIFKLDEVKEAVESQPVEPSMFDAKKATKVIDFWANKNMTDKYHGFDGRGMVIASIDSGIDVEHEDLRLDSGIFDNEAKIKKVNPDGYKEAEGKFTEKVPHGFNYCDGNFDMKDNFHSPHGQHIAGILAGNCTEEKEQAGLGVRGVAPNAQILSYRIFSDANDLDGYRPTSGDDAVYHAMEDAIKHGADVISLSIGDPGVGRRGDLYDTAVKNAQAQGVAVCVSMGNYGTAASSNTYDNYTTNDFGLTDTSMTVSGAANPDAIGVAAARSNGALYNTICIDGKDYPVAGIGKNFIENQKLLPKGKYEVVFLGGGSNADFNKFLEKDEDFFEGKIVAVIRDTNKRNTVFNKLDKAMSYGAIGFWLINDILPKTRDTYLTEMPTGWENWTLGTGSWMDPREMYACGMNGQTGKELFNLPDKNRDRLKPIEKVFKFSVEPKEYKTLANFANGSEISGFSAWGPNNQLELKPDITAPGQDIVSLGNKGKYVQMSGTSMSQPFIAGVTALLYSKVEKDMQSLLIKTKSYEKSEKTSVPKKIEAPGKFTKPELAKFLMMSTAHPMTDKKVKLNNDSFLESSPRHQGAGLVDVEAAFKTNVFLSHNDKGSISLKEIGDTTKFKVTLNNFSNKDQTFDITTSPVMTDEIRKVTKEETNSKEVIVNEIHPKVIKDAKISAEVETITVAANSKKNVEFTLNAKGENIFAEGFIYFNSKDDNQPNLSIPYMGFLGNWGKERIIDPPSWDESSKTGLTTILEATGWQGGKPTYREVGIDAMSDNKVNPDMIAMGTTAIIPRIIALRDANDYKISVVDESKKNTIKLIRNGHFYKKYIHGYFLERWWYPEIVLTPDVSLEFNGYLDNPGHELGELDFAKQVPEGQYFFKLEYRTKDNGPFQEYFIPFKVDRTFPEFEEDFAEYDHTQKKLYIKIKDNFGISYISGSLDGRKLNFKRSGQDYKTFVVENVTLSPSTTNKLYVEVRDFAGNIAKKQKNLTEDNKLISYANLDELKQTEMNSFNLECVVDSSRVDNIEATLNDITCNVSKEPNGVYNIFIDNIKEKNTLKIKLLKGKEEITSEIINIFRDNEEPVITDIKIENTSKNHSKISGKITDDISESKNILAKYSNTPWGFKNNRGDKVEIKEDGTFEIVVDRDIYFNKLYIKAKDEKGNETLKEIQLGEPEESSNSSSHSLSLGKIKSHALPGGREMVYPGSGVAWIAFSPEQIGPHNNSHILPGDGIDNPRDPYRAAIEFTGSAGDTMTVTSYNPVKTVEYIPLEEPNESQYPKTYTFLGNETKQLWAPIYSGFNTVNIKVVDKEGNTIVNRGYVFHMDMNGPGLELFNVKMPQGDIRPTIYFNSEDYTLEGKVYDDANGVYIRIGDKDVESWSLYGERNQERRFSHKGHIKDGQVLNIKVSDRFGTETKYQFLVKIDSTIPEISVEGLENANRDTVLRLNASDDIEVWESKILVNGKEYTGGALKDYEVAGKENKFFIYAYAKDLAGNISEIKKAINIDENLPLLDLKKKDFTQEEASDIKNVFDINEDLKVCYIEYADKYESSTLDEEWFDRETLNPYRIKDSLVLRELGENRIDIVVYDVFGRRQTQSYNINLVSDTDKNENNEPDNSNKPDTQNESSKPNDTKTNEIIKKELQDSVKLKKDSYKAGEFKGIGDELDYPEGVKISLKDSLETQTPGKKTFTVIIVKDGIQTEKTFTITVIDEKIEDLKKPQINFRPNINKSKEVKNTRRDFINVFEPSKSSKNTKDSVKISYEEKTQVTKEKSPLTNFIFKDINNHWAKDAIKFCLEKGYFKGVSKTEFAPDVAITRADFVTVLGRISDIDVSSYKNSNFTDVDDTSYYAAYVNWAYENKIVKGIGENKFAPKEKLTREQMALIIENYLKFIGKNLDKKDAKVFEDTNEISSWAKESVNNLTQKGIINGDEQGYFRPKSYVTRAQVAQILYNIFK